VEIELIRARWRRALERHALDDPRRDDFATGGLASRLDDNTFQILLLPADPETVTVTIDDKFWAWFEARRTTEVFGRPVRFGAQRRPTAHAAAFVDTYGGGHPWNHYLAIHRSGAMEMGMGTRGGWERDDRDGQRRRVFHLISIAAYTCAMLKVTAELDQRHEPAQPRLLTVALRDTAGAHLGNLGDGWAQPFAFDHRHDGCAEPHLLWHHEVEGLDLLSTAPEEIAISVADRLEDAWGCEQRRYIARGGPLAGQFDYRQIAD
jgi:hypothetical protein